MSGVVAAIQRVAPAVQILLYWPMKPGLRCKGAAPMKAWDQWTKVPVNTS